MTGKIVGDRYYIDGLEATKAEFDKAFPAVKDGPPLASRTNRAGVGEKLSDALAVHPRQVKEAVESAARRGVPTDFLPDGRPVIRSRAHQKAYLKAYGFYNRDGGYGD